MKLTMRKLLSIILVICLVAVMVGCGKDDDDDDDRKSDKKNTTTVDDKDKDKDKDKTPTPAETGDKTPTPGGDDVPTPTEKPTGSTYTIADQVLVDNELCTFKIVSAEEDSFWGFMLTVYCENKTTDKTLRFSADNVSVNGYLIDPYWSEDVDAGDKKNDDMTFNSDEFKKVGFTTPEEIKFTLRVYDSDTWSDENFVKENFTIYPTGKSAGEVTYPERKQEPGEQVAVDNENFTFIILNEENDDFWGYSLNCFFENKTDKTLMVTWDECTVNGFEIDPYWAKTIGPHSRGYMEIPFSDDDFTENGITTVEEIVYTMRIYNYDDHSEPDLFNEQLTYKPQH